MKAVRIVCPKCPFEDRIVTEEEDLSTYSEEIKYEVCPTHPITNEDKLLKAIIGEKE